jgi:hypothetical protein
MMKTNKQGTNKGPECWAYKYKRDQAVREIMRQNGPLVTWAEAAAIAAAKGLLR